MAYEIFNWDQYYESAYARRIKGALSWIPLPTSHDGKRYQRLVGHPESTKIFGAWCSILEIAAKCPKRGLLVDDRGNALTPEDMEEMAGFPAADYALALRVLSDSRIGWIAGHVDGLFDAVAADVPEQKKVSKPRKRDEVFDAVAEADGFQPNAKVPAPDGKRIGAIAAGLRAKGATADQVRERWAWIIREYPNATTHALPKHWDAAGREIAHRPHGQSVGRAGRDAMTDPREVQI